MKPYIFNYSEDIDINHTIFMNYDSQKLVNIGINSGNIIVNNFICRESTVDTESIENSDPEDDDSYFIDSTVKTDSIESSDEDSLISCSTMSTESDGEAGDNDEFMFDSPIITRSTKNQDEDSIIMGTTRLTETTESVDNDEFVMI